MVCYVWTNDTLPLHRTCYCGSDFPIENALSDKNGKMGEGKHDWILTHNELNLTFLVPTGCVVSSKLSENCDCRTGHR